MPFKRIEVSANARGGTELMVQALESKLIDAGRQDLLDRFDFYPSRVRDFDPTRQSIFWAHDLPGDPESEHLKHDGGKRFDAMVFVSDWQHQQYMNYYGLSGRNALVLRNAIEPFDSDVLQKWLATDIGTAENPVRLIYHTTPHRGLELLIPVYEMIYQHFVQQGIHCQLDVYSSFSIYGWESRDEPYRGLFDKCRNHPGIKYHGAVPNEQIRSALKASHIFAFPSIWQETSCIALIEAMSAGNIAVHSNLAALPETGGGMTVCYPIITDHSEHASRFAGQLAAAIQIAVQDSGEAYSLAWPAHMRANSMFGWDRRIQCWIELLDSIPPK